jgi:hypothetical protein
MSEERLLFEHAFYDRVFHKENGNAFARQLNMHIRPIQIAHPISNIPAMPSSQRHHHLLALGAQMLDG